MDRDGYDDGGVGDLSLVMDLEDHIVRRKKGDADYQMAHRADLLPRIKKGNYATLTRRDQKIQLAQMLFGDGDADADTKASEVYMDNEREMDDATKQQRLERLNIAKQCLEISYILREVACQSLSLSEISKRHLALKGKDGAEDALRCATKAAEIASNEFYDNDEIFMEVSLSCGSRDKCSLVANVLFIVFSCSISGETRPKGRSKSGEKCHLSWSWTSQSTTIPARTSVGSLSPIRVFAHGQRTVRSGTERRRP